MIENAVGQVAKWLSAILIAVGAFTEHWLALITLAVVIISHCVKLWIEWYWKRKSYERGDK